MALGFESGSRFSASSAGSFTLVELLVLSSLLAILWHFCLQRFTHCEARRIEIHAVTTCGKWALLLRRTIALSARFRLASATGGHDRDLVLISRRGSL